MRGLRSASAVGGVLLSYTLLALWITRPLVWNFRDHSLAAFAVTSFDVPLNAWVLSWGTHAALTQPFRFFDANIFHPIPSSLAYTEHMLGILPFFAPGYLVTGSPVIGLNVMILAALVLSAAGMFFLVWRWTRSWPAAFLAGLLFGFYPEHVRALGPNLQTVQYLPWILLFLDEVLDGSRSAATLGLTIALFGQCATSYYFAYPVFLGTIAALLATSALRRSRPRAGAIGRVAVALVIVGVLMAVLSIPYWRAAARGFLTVYDTALYKLPMGIGRLGASVVQLVGSVPLLLAAVAVAYGLRSDAERSSSRRVLILLAWILAGCVLAAGSTLEVGGTFLPMPARLLAEYAPGFRALRDRHRLLVVVPAAVSALAGIGVVRIAESGPRRLRTTIALCAAGIGALGFALTIDLGPCTLMKLPTPEEVPAIYESLAEQDSAPVLVLPAGVDNDDLLTVRTQTLYEYYSIFHWRPLLNGYASYWPPELDTFMALARALPDARALDTLVACTALRWVVLHGGKLSPGELERWKEPVAGLELVSQRGQDRLYRVRDARGRWCNIPPKMDELGPTLLGTARQALAPRDRVALALQVEMPATLVPSWMGFARSGRVRLRNTGHARWPAVGVGSRGLVQLTYRWLDATGNALSNQPPRSHARLPTDLAPGEETDVPFAYYAPSEPGVYRLQVLLEQAPDLPFELTGAGAEPREVRIAARQALE